MSSSDPTASSPVPQFDAGTSSRHAHWMSYGMALLSTATAGLLTWTLPEPHAQPFLIFYMAGIMVSAWYGGWRAGAMAIAATVAWLGYFHSQDIGMRVAEEPTYVMRLTLTGLLMAWVVGEVGRRKSAQTRLEAERRELQAALAEQAAMQQKRDLYREIFNSSQDAISILDPEGHYLEQNAAYRALIGYGQEELRGKTPAVHMGEENFRRILGELREKGSFRGEITGRRKTGEPVHFEFSSFPVRDAAGRVTCYVNVKRDIGERKKVETALVESENKFRAVAETAACAIYIHDGKRLLYVNHAVEQITGYTREEILASDMWSLVHPDYRDEVQRRAAARFRGEPAPARYEYKIIARSGQERWLDFSASMVNFGGKAAILATAFDVTERKKAEEALRMSEKLAATGRLAATIAHEINNPLESVTNLIYLLERHPGLDQKARDYARVAQQELGRVAHIARQTLGFYRESADPAEFSTRELLENVLQLYARKLELAGVLVEARLETDGIIQGRPGELRQVFSNLVTNAMEAAGRGGAVAVHLFPAPGWKCLNGNGVCVVIADNGPGIPRMHHQHLFEPFFTTKGDKGTGLGLWVSAGIVRKHGGHIRMRSSTRPGRSGTAFWVSLPAHMPQEQEQEQASAAELSA